MYLKAAFYWVWYRCWLLNRPKPCVWTGHYDTTNQTLTMVGNGAGHFETSFLDIVTWHKCGLFLVLKAELQWKCDSCFISGLYPLSHDIHIDKKIILKLIFCESTKSQPTTLWQYLLRYCDIWFYSSIQLHIAFALLLIIKRKLN